MVDDRDFLAILADSEGGGPAAAALYVTLHHCLTRGTNTTHVTVPKLAQITRYSPPTIKRHLAYLVDKGYISRDYTLGADTHAVTTITNHRLSTNRRGLIGDTQSITSDTPEYHQRYSPVPGGVSPVIPITREIDKPDRTDVSQSPSLDAPRGIPSGADALLTTRRTVKQWADDPRFIQALEYGQVPKSHWLDELTYACEMAHQNKEIKYPDKYALAIIRKHRDEPRWEPSPADRLATGRTMIQPG